MRVTFIIIAVFLSDFALSAQDSSHVHFEASIPVANSSGTFWTLDSSPAISIGYPLSPTLLVRGSFEYSRLSHTGHLGPSSVATRNTFSSWASLQMALLTSNKAVIPYFHLGLGISHTSSSSNTIEDYIGDSKETIRLGLKSGWTPSYVMGVGFTVGLWRDLSTLAEVRAAKGYESSIYDLIITYRIGAALKI